MPLSWNEIKDRAMKFSKEWEHAHYEKGETQSFYNDFFDVFGVSRRKVAFFEKSIMKLNNTTGFIDLFWPGTLLIEQKSAGRSLEDARKQVFNEYLPGLNDKEFPQYILLSDFQHFELLDLEQNQEIGFSLPEFHKYIHHFHFLAGYKTHVYRDQDPVNIEASELMSHLHRMLEDSGYTGHDLELLLVRLMFCLFADDTGIFPKDHFTIYLENHTHKDGSDLGGHLLSIFDVLNTSEHKRQKTLNEDLELFPYVNGKLFASPLRPIAFNRPMREALMVCCYFDWSRVSPALFGSLFQTVMIPEEQRKKGAHYTSENNILKAIKPLFLDKLWIEFDRIKNNKKKLEEFHTKLGRIIMMDPACGCGNFLILAYREIRELELQVIQTRYKKKTDMLDIKVFSQVDVDQFYGIELEEFPARIAETAIWLVDHQMNLKLSEAFGEEYIRLPLQKSATIIHGNALALNWAEIVDPNDLSYIISNPPFIGSKFMSEVQRTELKALLPGVKGTGILDYVCAWYAKASQYIQGTPIKVAFVSTNSITQGEQVAVLWNELLNRRGIHINFAHTTFKWSIDEKKAHGMHVAAVYVVIIGFAGYSMNEKRLIEYPTLTSKPHEISVKNINPYLVDGPEVVITKRSHPLSDVPEIKFGNQPIDGGHFIFSPEEYKDAIAIEPEIKKYFRLFLGSEELINGKERFCLWLHNANPKEIRTSKIITERLKKVRQFRLDSKREDTRKLAEIPSRFGFISHEDRAYIAIPSVSSERRKYIPIVRFDPSVICSNLCLIVPGADLYHFGILTSLMHMAWVRYVCGRLKSDYRYSNQLVYNNFPWPKVSPKQKMEIEQKAEMILHTRNLHTDNSLADLYDPDTMPLDLLKSHQELDKAVDKSYRSLSFKNEKERIVFLFELYEKHLNLLYHHEK